MSTAFSGIKDYIQLTATTRFGAPMNTFALLAAIVVGIALVVVYIGKSASAGKTDKRPKRTKFLRRRCDDDQEVSAARSNQQRSSSDKKLRRLLQRFQRKSGTPILAAMIQDPYEKRSNKTNDDLKDSEEMNTSGSSLDESDRVWASGTGYGCSFDNASWDMHEWDSKQSQSYEELIRFIDQITALLSEISVEENMRRVVRRSCLILFLDEHLSGSSMSIMNKHYSFFVSLFSLLNAVADHRPELHSLFTMHIRLVSKTKINMWKTLNKLYDQAKQAATLSSFHLDEDADDIAQHVIPTFENMKSKFEESGGLFFDVLAHDGEVDGTEKGDAANTASNESEQDSSTDNDDDEDKVVDKSTSGDEEDDSKDLEISYVECMKDLQFDMVKSFENHRFSADCNANGAPGRKLIRRLGSEFSDLAVSLPLTEESSIYLRVSESRMDMVKFLIIPADGTPYAGGCFIFDAYFPPVYPDGPPKVNLMTTGGGTVRFNPNLYEDGYVCLSLLGTWSGHSDGERWQPNISTFLQVVLSVQCLIFVPKPYYNEPGYESYSDMDDESEAYSQDKRENTVRYAMIDLLENPAPEFKDVIMKHFYLSRDRCMKNAKTWLGESHDLVIKLQALLDGLEEPDVR